MTVLDESLDQITTELCRYLKKLGLDVDRDGRTIDGTRRTSLANETHRIKVVARPPAREPKSVIHIVPDAFDGAAKLVPNVYRFSEFLDRTIQADVICNRILEDEEIETDLNHFVPQHIAVNGASQTVDAPRYVDQWLSEAQGGLLAVLAPAGYGKTVLTRVIAHRLARAHMDQSNRASTPFPFLISFGNFRRVASFESMILEALHRRGVTDVTAAAFAHLVQLKRCVLLLDGFDELLEERPVEARKNLLELLETLGGESRVMVTARSTFFRTSTDVADFLEHGVSADDVTVVDLRPFDATQRRTLVQKLSPDQRTITYINNILEIEGVTEAMGSPLLLRETIEALRDPRIRTQLTADTKRSGLFEVLEASVYERERQRHGHRFSDRVQARFIEGAAEEMLRANARGFDRESIDVLGLEAAADFDFEASEADFSRLSDHHFLTVDHLSEVVRFNHQVFREYFQAKALLRGSRAEASWVKAVLHERPLPEEVSRFFAETSDDGDAYDVICNGVGVVSTSGGYLANNLARLCQAVGTRQALQSLLACIDPSVLLTLRLDGVDLRGIDLGSRMFERLELVACDLAGADLTETLIRELVISDTRLTKARLAPGSPEVLQVNYKPRQFEPTEIQATLNRLGVVGLELSGEEDEAAMDSWRSDVQELVASRVRRFLTSVEGSAYLWDKSIGERALLGGLDQVDRWVAAQRLIPEMLRHGLITKHREHNNVVYRLTDEGKSDGRALLEGVVQGVLRDVLDALAPAS